MAIDVTQPNAFEYLSNAPITPNIIPAEQVATNSIYVALGYGLDKVDDDNLTTSVISNYQKQFALKEQVNSQKFSYEFVTAEGRSKIEPPPVNVFKLTKDGRSSVALELGDQEMIFIIQPTPVEEKFKGNIGSQVIVPGFEVESFLVRGTDGSYIDMTSLTSISNLRTLITFSESSGKSDISVVSKDSVVQICPKLRDGKWSVIDLALSYLHECGHSELRSYEASKRLGVGERERNANALLLEKVRWLDKVAPEYIDPHIAQQWVDGQLANGYGYLTPETIHDYKSNVEPEKHINYLKKLLMLAAAKSGRQNIREKLSSMKSNLDKISAEYQRSRRF